MASEDSEQVEPRLLAIHRLRDLDNVGQSFKREMMARLDEFDAQRELLKVPLLDECMGFARKNGMIASIKSFRRRTT